MIRPAAHLLQVIGFLTVGLAVARGLSPGGSRAGDLLVFFLGLALFGAGWLVASKAR
ncbi:MAG: hypothetical protein HYY13_13330 [Nitrospirae bacterium]|nr:hypothetical protein [Nitrospirota bacterium]